MSQQDGVYGSASVRITCAPGSVTEVIGIEGQNSMSIKMISGPTLGTVEIGGPTGTYGGQSLTGFQTFGLMYPISSNEVVSWNMSGKFYLWCSGATCVVAILKGRTAGF